MIEKLTIQNFKNYENQEIEFPITGFILIAGPNGSGKSGIGEAIGFSLGLEGLMSFLRQSGRKVIDLIKNEMDEAEIAIILNNKKRGEIPPFQTNSERIEIIRKIRNDGNSSIKAIGFPTTLYTLQEIHKLANFNATNPFIFIPQGKLSDLIPININRKTDIKYLEEFEKITGLTDLKFKIIESNEKLQESISILNSFKENQYQPARDFLMEIERVFELYVDFECKKLELLASQLIYHLVQKNQVEQEYNQCMEELNSSKTAFESITRQLEELQQELKYNEEKRQYLLKTLNEKNIILGPLTEKKKTLKLERINAQNTQIEEKAKLKNYQLREKELSEKIDGLKEQLNILSKDHNEDTKTNEMIMKLKALEDELDTIEREKVRKIEETSSIYLRDLKEINGSLRKEQDFYERIHFLKDEMGQVEKEINDQNSRFYPVIQRIEDFIKTRNLKILGPAGKYIEILDPKAWEAIEIALGYPILHSFITFNEKDQKEFDKYIIKNKIYNIRCYWYPPTVESPPIKEFSIPNKKVLGRVVDLIRITQDPIKLILNENNGKNWIVCQDEATADEVTKSYRKTAISVKGLIKEPTKYGEGVISSLRNANKAILSIGSRKDELEQYQREYSRLSELNKKYDLEKKTLINAFDSDIRIIKSKIEDLQQSLKSKSTAFAEIQIRIDENEKDLTKIQSEVEITNNLLKEVTNLIGELGNESDSLDTGIDKFTAEIADLDPKIKEIDISSQKSQLECDQLNDKLVEFNIRELEYRIDKLQENLNQLNTVIKEIQGKAADLLKSLQQQMQVASPIELKLYKPQEDLLEHIRVLEQNEEIKKWNLLDIHDDIIKLETIIGATKIAFDTIDKYTSAKKEFDTLEEQKKHLEITIQMRESEYKKNFEDWYSQINDLLEHLKVKFKEYIESIGGNGYIRTANLESPIIARMDLFATFKENTPPRSIASHTHSGGEKTMIIMAFILALQSLKPQPFYILDEPDAHLDPENRDKLFRMIKDASKETQYIVISPQENRERHLLPDVIFYLFNNAGKTVIKKLN